MIFSSLTLRCNSSKSSSTMVLSNPLAGGRLLPLLRERLEDLDILHRLKARYQLQVCIPQLAQSTIQTTRTFQGAYFCKPLTTHCQSSTKNRQLPGANSMKHARFLVTIYSKHGAQQSCSAAWVSSNPRATVVLVWRASPFPSIVQHRVRKMVWYNIWVLCRI